MKKMTFWSMIIAIMMALPLVVSCGSSDDEGIPITFTVQDLQGDWWGDYNNGNIYHFEVSNNHISYRISNGSTMLADIEGDFSINGSIMIITITNKSYEGKIIYPVGTTKELEMKWVNSDKTCINLNYIEFKK